MAAPVPIISECPSYTNCVHLWCMWMIMHKTSNIQFRCNKFCLLIKVTIHGVQILLLTDIQWDTKSKWNLTLPYHMNSSLLLVPTMSQCRQLNPHHIHYFMKLTKMASEGFLLCDCRSNQYLKNYIQIKKEITTQDNHCKSKGEKKRM
jgi:hypothetical protein